MSHEYSRMILPAPEDMTGGACRQLQPWPLEDPRLKPLVIDFDRELEAGLLALIGSRLR